jgi:hypothetical protein
VALSARAMLISYEPPRFIFVHIYKAAGKSVAAALDPHGQRVPDECIFHPDFVQHLSAKHLKAGLPRAAWDEAYKFSFVRNPWDRWVSLYEFILAKKRNRDHQRVVDLGSFSAFVRWVYSGENPEVLISRTQQDFLCDDDGQLLVDYVGRFESLAADFASVCGTLGVEAELGHLNANAHDRYSGYYDDDTRTLVEKGSRFEIERFGYSFETTTPA